MKNFTPANALRVLLADADEDMLTAALTAVVDLLPSELSTSDDMSSAVIADTIFAELTGDGA